MLDKTSDSLPLSLIQNDQPKLTMCSSIRLDYDLTRSAMRGVGISVVPVPEKIAGVSNRESCPEGAESETKRIAWREVASYSGLRRSASVS